jgi:hypothetical protein
LRCADEKKTVITVNYGTTMTARESITPEVMERVAMLQPAAFSNVDQRFPRVWFYG